MKIITALFFLGICVQANAQQAFAPSRTEMLKRYQHADERDSLVRRTIFKSNVVANWTGASSFWYRNLLADSAVEYIYVDAAKNLKKQLFDAEKMATALGTATGMQLRGNRLPIREIYVYPGEQQIAVAAGTSFYQVNLANYQTTKLEALPTDKSKYPELTQPTSRWQRSRNERMSPDKSQIVMIKDFNIVLQPADSTQQSLPLTKDGTQSLPWGDVSWSPDGRYLIAYKEKRVIDKPVYHILSSLPGTTRGQLQQQNYKQPGDEFSTYEMYLLKVADKSVTKVKTDLIDFFDAPRLRWNAGDNNHFLYERVDRGHQRFRIIEVNVNDASTRNIVDEKTKTFIYEQKIVTHYLPATSEIIWVTEKDGWRQKTIYQVNKSGDD